jgi:hypothetical protein
LRVTGIVRRTDAGAVSTEDMIYFGDTVNGMTFNHIDKPKGDSFFEMDTYCGGFPKVALAPRNTWSAVARPIRVTGFGSTVWVSTPTR